VLARWGTPSRSSVRNLNVRGVGAGILARLHLTRVDYVTLRGPQQYVYMGVRRQPLDDPEVRSGRGLLFLTSVAITK